VIFENFLKFSKRRRAVPLRPIWTIVVAAKLDQSRVRVTKFRQNRLTLKVEVAEGGRLNAGVETFEFEYAKSVVNLARSQVYHTYERPLVCLYSTFAVSIQMFAYGWTTVFDPCLL